MATLRIALASDHGGFEQKEKIASWLKDQGYAVQDFGCFSSDSVDYPDYAKFVGEAVSHNEADFGVLICGTGIGMMIAANKIHGVRAANIVSKQFAQLAREHNNANVITLSGRFVPLEENIDILKTFLNTSFEAGRHERRVEKIMALEDSE